MSCTNPILFFYTTSGFVICSVKLAMGVCRPLVLLLVNNFSPNICPLSTHAREKGEGKNYTLYGGNLSVAHNHVSLIFKKIYGLSTFFGLLKVETYFQIAFSTGFSQVVSHQSIDRS